MSELHRHHGRAGDLVTVHQVRTTDTSTDAEDEVGAENAVGAESLRRPAPTGSVPAHPQRRMSPDYYLG